MPKIGRNEPCPCGSGKKYKRCCLAKNAEFERKLIAAAAVTPADDHHDHRGFCDDCYNQLVEASNAVVELVDAGRLDEAEQAAHLLLERFPDVHDGYARLGLVHELRGNTRQAIEYYRKVIDFAREHPDLPVFEDDYRRLIDRLERPTAAG
jgi:tetratricopeptide (TPR) repeat protein